MTLGAFSIARLPRIVFGDGEIARVPGLAAGFGSRVLLVTGKQSFRRSGRHSRLTHELSQRGLSLENLSVSGEPSPELVDGAVKAYADAAIDVVVGIGGGSVLDAAKAIAGLLPFRNSVMDHLEGVGRGIEYVGPATPFIAVPTTAGTGSEATKNAVLSVQGRNGFKKSFRHEALVPQYAVVDPALLEGSPPDLIAADGMDAFTQLLESYVSTKANPVTDALALSGLTAWRDGFWQTWQARDAAVARTGRERLAYASLVSGICLAQTGLGSVHGLASALGGSFPIPHGVVCGTLVAEATAVNMRAMREREPTNAALAKYERLAATLLHRADIEREATTADLATQLWDWTARLGLARLGDYGVTNADIELVVAGARGSSMKTNPIVLTDQEIADVVRARL